MAEFPFTLKGNKIQSRGSGNPNEYESKPFYLRAGLAIVEILHHGAGDFELEIMPAEGLRADDAREITEIGGMGTAIATGAAIGSIVPGIGTLAGAAIAGTTAYFTSRKAEEYIGSKIIPTTFQVEHKGQLDDRIMFLVNNQENKVSLSPGNHIAKVKSKAKWSIRLIQPDHGQSTGIITDLSEENDDQLEDYGAYIFPPMEVGLRPVIAKVQKKEFGPFRCSAYSLDGTHHTVIHHEEGQFTRSEIRTDLIPGKEYMLEIYSEGPWNIWFTEGY